MSKISPELTQELSATWLAFTSHPPFPTNQDTINEFGGVIAESPGLMFIAPMLEETAKQWGQLVMKVALIYAMLGVKIEAQAEESPFIKKLWKEE